MITVIGVALITGLGCLMIGWSVGNECGTANGAREERIRMAQKQRQ